MQEGGGKGGIQRGFKKKVHTGMGILLGMFHVLWCHVDFPPEGCKPPWNTALAVALCTASCSIDLVVNIFQLVQEPLLLRMLFKEHWCDKERVLEISPGFQISKEQLRSRFLFLKSELCFLSRIRRNICLGRWWTLEETIHWPLRKAVVSFRSQQDSVRPKPFRVAL